MILAEFGAGQVFWSLLWFALFFLWWWTVIVVFASIISSKALSGWAKAMWAVGILILPFLGVFMYLIVHGDEVRS